MVGVRVATRLVCATPFCPLQPPRDRKLWRGSRHSLRCREGEKEEEEKEEKEEEKEEEEEDPIVPKRR